MVNPKLFTESVAMCGASSLVFVSNAPDGFRVLIQKIKRGGADAVEVAAIDLPALCFDQVVGMLPLSVSGSAFDVVGYCFETEYSGRAHYSISWKSHGLTFSASWWSSCVVALNRDSGFFEYVREVREVEATS
jgi:hypothetical protein